MTSTQKLTEQLTIDAGNPVVDIKVFDGAFRLRASGSGRIDETLPTGFYTVRYSAGDAREEKEITLRPGAPVVLTEPPTLPFSSAAPLPLTSTSRPYHQTKASRLSRENTLKIGDGSYFFLFVRDVDVGLEGNPAQGLTLHRMDGTQVADLAEAAPAGGGEGEAPCAGRNIELDPGSYFLRLALEPEQSIEIVLHLVKGWQSQLFLLRGGGGLVQGKQPLPDLPAATLLMAHPDQGFDPEKRVTRRPQDLDPSEDLRLSELARQALAAGRSNISPADLQLMLNGKWVDPLLGIFGVHLLLMGLQPDLEFATTVVGRLQGIVAKTRHPDIEVLALEVARRRGAFIEIPPFEAPPMLRRSWEMLIHHSAHEPQLIRSGTLLDRIAGRLWGSGAWLMWQAEPATGRSATILGRVLGFSRSIMATVSVPTVLNVLTNAKVWLRKDQTPDPALRDLANRLPFLLTLINELPNAPAGSLDAVLDKLVPVLRDSAFPAITAALQQIANELGRRLDQITSGPGLEQLCQKAQLGQLERTLLLYLLGQVGLQQLKGTQSADVYSLQTLVDRLGLPASQIVLAAAGLVIKLAGVLGRDRGLSPESST
jgi:hypothetical protein